MKPETNARYRLDETQRAALSKQMKSKECCAEERMRILCIYWVGCGKEIKWVSEHLFLEERRIYRYLQNYHRTEKTTPGSHGGSKSHLSQEQTTALTAHLEERVYRTTMEICAYVKEAFNVQYTPHSITKRLHQLGFRYKRPRLVPYTVSVEKQKDFITAYEKLKAELKNKEEIWFIDGVHPDHQTQAVHGWIKKSRLAQVPSTGKQKRVHYLGAVRVQAEKVEHFCIRYDTINSEGVIDFLKQLEASRQGKKINIICDRGSYHTSIETKAYVDSRQNTELIYLPPRSPNLNLIERLWKVLRENVTYNRYYSHFSDFTAAIEDFFARKIFLLQPLLVRRLCDNFDVIAPDFLSS